MVNIPGFKKKPAEPAKKAPETAPEAQEEAKVPPQPETPATPAPAASAAPAAQPAAEPAKKAEPREFVVRKPCKNGRIVYLPRERITEAVIKKDNISPEKLQGWLRWRFICPIPKTRAQLVAARKAKLEAARKAAEAAKKGK